MTEKERMEQGLIYNPGDPAIQKIQLTTLDKLYDFNHTRPSEVEKRAHLLKEMFAEIGENCHIEPPFHANWGGKHVHFGNGIYANFNLTVVDDGHIYVGDHVMFGPNVTISTAGHPIEPTLRHLQFNIDIHIGNNVWFGAGVVVMPGVTIGENSVIGAGSVVTKNIPANVIAVGNPCKILRQINEHDKEYYFKDRKIDITL